MSKQLHVHVMGFKTREHAEHARDPIKEVVVTVHYTHAANHPSRPHLSRLPGAVYLPRMPRTYPITGRHHHTPPTPTSAASCVRHGHRLVMCGRGGACFRKLFLGSASHLGEVSQNPRPPHPHGACRLGGFPVTPCSQRSSGEGGKLSRPGGSGRYGSGATRSRTVFAPPAMRHSGMRFASHLLRMLELPSRFGERSTR